MSRINISMVKAMIAIFAIALTALAGTAQMISYQGFLTDADNQPVTGDRQMVFTIYDAPQNGSTLWSSGQVPIHIEDGMFSYLIGEDPNQLPPGCFADTGRWLGIQILPDSEMTPRTRITSVPYSHQSLNADTAEVGGGWKMESDGKAIIDISTVDANANVIIGSGIPYTSAKVEITSDVVGQDLLHLGDSALVVDEGGTVLVGTAIVVQNPDLGYTPDLVWDDDIIVETMDAVVGLYSMPDASYGSAVSLSEVGGGALTDKWAILRETTSGPLGGSGLRFTYGTDKNQANNPTFMRINRDGNVGIGAADPWVYKLYVEGSRDYPGAVACVKNLNTNNGHGMHIENWSYGLTLLLSQQGSHPDGEIFRCDSYTGGWHSVFLLKNSGRVICKTLELEGGTDLAEPFEISAGKELPEGALVVIDEDNPGKLTLSERPYDTRVAGVISGAGGISPGVTLTQEKMFDQGQNVAIGGRVYCLADASYGSIKPGDMLTTSPTPGHAMKAVDRAKAYGAVIGKAMTSLDEGQGLVLVLVSLQ